MSATIPQDGTYFCYAQVQCDNTIDGKNMDVNIGLYNTTTSESLCDYTTYVGGQGSTYGRFYFPIGIVKKLSAKDVVVTRMRSSATGSKFVNGSFMYFKLI